MLGEWALLGFLLTTGRLVLPDTSGERFTSPPEFSEAAEILQAMRHLEQAATQLGGFDEA
jgi:hypothetical protein